MRKLNNSQHINLKLAWKTTISFLLAKYRLNCWLYRNRIVYNYNVSNCSLIRREWMYNHSDNADSKVNSLTPGWFEWNFRQIIFKLILIIYGWGTSCEIALMWFSLDLTDDKSTLVQPMAWSHHSFTWANVDTDLCRLMTSLNQNELIPFGPACGAYMRNINWLGFEGAKPHSPLKSLLAIRSALFERKLWQTKKHVKIKGSKRVSLQVHIL